MGWVRRRRTWRSALPAGRRQPCRACSSTRPTPCSAKRGEIQHGIDRYGQHGGPGFLLQRLEQSDSLVILASNLKENIDPAFTRRFHYIVQFPPARAWKSDGASGASSFPPEAPAGPPTVDPSGNHSPNWDMTGAAIAGCRSEPLPCWPADTGSPLITRGSRGPVAVSRQVTRRDSRLLRLGGSRHVTEAPGRREAQMADLKSMARTPQPPHPLPGPGRGSSNDTDDSDQLQRLYLTLPCPVLGQCRCAADGREDQPTGPACGSGNRRRLGRDGPKAPATTADRTRTPLVIDEAGTWRRRWVAGHPAALG